MNDLETFVDHKKGFILADVGGSVTLQCSFDEEEASYFWYKQSLGQKPQQICMSYKLDKGSTFYGEFKNKPRFSVKTEVGKSRLSISNLHSSDTGTYLCASGLSFLLTFVKGVTVVVKDSAVGGEALVHQAASESARPGDSVTLNCTVQTGSCQGEHRVYWFRKSTKYDPGLVYAHGDTADQCLTSPDTQTHTCLYKLPMENIKKSHVGTYYCAVASCGRIDFGNGTKLELESEAVSLVLVYFLCAALIFTIILNVLLAVKLYKKHNKDSCQTSGNCWVCSQVIHISSFKKKNLLSFTVFQGKSSSCPAADGEEDNLHYAAVNVNQPTRSRRQKKSQETECVYSSMKQ
ncbi:V-set and immunoglobulin domain-containing protein 1-like isoform X1 [Poecilia formosa]|uniref:V-set and immunoglobulin domain-containing protein 1-like isoform X1 n=1 Tax=Poecilia formosa TaxID=48698 RepID=UPI0007BA1808|nr:PREDICTED: V-set and immunoglobulin domain-containing protein 1-like isoform X1 [Poecilia formosa]